MVSPRKTKADEGLTARRNLQWNEGLLRQPCVSEEVARVRAECEGV